MSTVNYNALHFCLAIKIYTVKRLLLNDSTLWIVKDDSDSGSEPNFFDSKDAFDDFDDHSDSNNSDSAQEIGPVNRQVRGGPCGRKGHSRAGPCNCGSRKQIQNNDADWNFLDCKETYEEWISEFIENTGYTGDKSMANAGPLNFFHLSLMTNSGIYWLQKRTGMPQSILKILYSFTSVKIPEMG